MAHAFARKLAGGQARVEHGMRLGHVRAPRDEDVGLVKVGVAAGGLVGLEHVHEAHHGAGHAQARVRARCCSRAGRPSRTWRVQVAFDDGLLAAAPEGQAALVVLPGLAAALPATRSSASSQRRLAQAFVGALGGLVVADERRGQAVVAVQDLRQVVALDAVEPAVRPVVGVAGHRNQPAVLHFADDAASAAAETAHRQIRLAGAVGRCARLPAAGAAHERRHGACRGGAGQCDGGGLDEQSPGNVHVQPSLSPCSS